METTRLLKSAERDEIQKKKEQQLVNEADVLLRKADMMLVATDEDAEVATNLLAAIKISMKTMENERVWLVKPLNDHVGNINKRFKLYSEPLKKAENIVKGKILKYRNEMERLRREEEARLKKEAEEKNKKQAELAEQNGLPAPPPIVLKKPATIVPKKVKGAIGTTSFTKKWGFKIVDVDQIPREYMIPDEKKIRALVNAGIREIPGVLIFQEETVSIRTS